MKKKLITAAFFLFFMVSTGANAELKTGFMNVSNRPSPESGLTKIEVVIWLMDIDSINSAEQSFDANIIIRLTWKDPSLAHSGNGPVKGPLESIWNPAIQIINEGRLVRKTLPEVAIVQPDGTVTYMQRYVGVFSQPLELYDFPFDQHKFTISFVAPSYTSDMIQFVPEEKTVNRGIPYAADISKKISIPDWEILGFKAENTPYLITGSHNNAGYTFEFSARRLIKYYLLKIIMPLILIVMMSWVVFYIDPENSGTQISASITSMLTLIAYRFAIDTQVPKVSYMTTMDEFIFMCTLIVYFALVQVIITSMLARSNKIATARKLDKVCRIAFPIVFFTGAYLVLFS
jgi:hypothetical protein